MADSSNPGQFGNRSDTEEMASEGGKAAHKKGTAHEFNSQEASEAGKKGGRSSSSSSSTTSD